jgi:hypothetical protein
MIGPAAIPAIARVVDNPFTPALLAGSAMTGLEQIALNHPGCRGECIDIVTRLLCRSGTDRLARGFGASSLLKLNAVEAIEPLRDAFRSDVVDISVAGDLEDIEIALGFRTHRDTPEQHHVEAEGWSLPPRGLSPDAPVQVEKTGRNEPCPCGSGRKYEKCCLH